jgi:hypothetical protein
MTEFGQRHATLVPPLPRLRLTAAALVLGAALAGAAILHGHRALHAYGCSSINTKVAHSCFYIVRLERPGWVDPLALAICLLGVAAATHLLLGLRALLRLAGAGVIFGAALAGAVLVSGYRVVGSGHQCPYGASAYDCTYHPRPSWVAPTMAGLLVLGLTGASGILVATRRRST